MTLETCRCQTRLDLRRVVGNGREDVTARDDSDLGRAHDARVTHAASSARIRRRPYESAADRPIIADHGLIIDSTRALDHRFAINTGPIVRVWAARAVLSDLALSRHSLLRDKKRPRFMSVVQRVLGLHTAKFMLIDN